MLRCRRSPSIGCQEVPHCLFHCIEADLHGKKQRTPFIGSERHRSAGDGHASEEHVVVLCMKATVYELRSFYSPLAFPWNSLGPPLALPWHSLGTLGASLGLAWPSHGHALAWALPCLCMVSLWLHRNLLGSDGLGVNLDVHSQQVLSKEPIWPIAMPTPRLLEATRLLSPGLRPTLLFFGDRRKC